MASCGDSKPTSKPTLQHHIAFGRMLDPHGLSPDVLARSSCRMIEGKQSSSRWPGEAWRSQDNPVEGSHAIAGPAHSTLRPQDICDPRLGPKVEGLRDGAPQGRQPIGPSRK